MSKKLFATIALVGFTAVSAVLATPALAQVQDGAGREQTSASDFSSNRILSGGMIDNEQSNQDGGNADAMPEDTCK